MMTTTTDITAASSQPGVPPVVDVELADVLVVEDSVEDFREPVVEDVVVVILGIAPLITDSVLSPKFAT
jgi:hypothetical protein